MKRVTAAVVRWEGGRVSKGVIMGLCRRQIHLLLWFVDERGTRGLILSTEPNPWFLFLPESCWLLTLPNSREKKKKKNDAANVSFAGGIIRHRRLTSGNICSKSFQTASWVERKKEISTAESLLILLSSEAHPTTQYPLYLTLRNRLGNMIIRITFTFPIKVFEYMYLNYYWA